MTHWQSAYEGVQEEIKLRKADRLAERIHNCGRPYDWSDKLTGEWRVGYQFCKHWSCDYCNERRATSEQARIERALVEHGSVYAVFDLSDRQWPKLARLLSQANITKNMYRRLPQDDRKVTVFFVGNPGKVASFATVVKINENTISNDENATSHSWLDLARKREGKRTSGNLGKEPELEPTGPELTSVKILAVRGEKDDNGVSSFDKLAAMKKAESATEGIEPQDKEHLEQLIKQTAEAYESALRDLGCKTYRVVLYRKMDLSLLGKTGDATEKITSICTKNKRHIDDKSKSVWYQLAWQGVQDEISRLGADFQPVLSDI